jgi:hypothetical protein
MRNGIKALQWEQTIPSRDTTTVGLDRKGKVEGILIQSEENRKKSPFQ